MVDPAETLRFVKYVFFLILVFVLSRLSASAEAAPSTPAPTIRAEFFGFHAHRLGESTTWPQAEFRSYRTWDYKVRWADLEPKRDQWEFKRLDALVAEAQRRRVGVLMPLGMPPAWASARPTEPSAYGAGQAALPVSAELWQEYVRTVVKRYAGRIEAYEIWNEPNLPKFFSGTPADAVRLTCTARDIVRSLDPKARVVSPAPLGDYGVKWLDEFLGRGGGDCIDVVGYHFYNKHRPPETHVRIHEDILQVMRRHGRGELPVWNTESGWLIANRDRDMEPEVAGFGRDAPVLSAQDAASYLARMLLVHASLGIERSYWYALDNHAMGLVERDGTPKPVYDAYRRMAAMLTGNSVACSSEDARWRCEVRSGAEVRVVVQWSLDSSDAAPAPAFKHRVEVFGASPDDTLSAQPPGRPGRVLAYWRE